MPLSYGRFGGTSKAMIEKPFGAWTPPHFVAARFKGSTGGDTWPCRGVVELDLPASDVAPFALGGIVEALGPDRCRLTLGAWSWIGLAATLGRFDTGVRVVDPPQLRDAFATLSDRYAAAARPWSAAAPG